MTRSGYAQLVGRSPVMLALQAEIHRVAQSEAKILITGESGVGKELVAMSIHAQSPRASLPFVTVNCAGLPETLLESELFGHVKGSFTGAYRDKPGMLEKADEGSIFLDEIGEMSLRMQGMLLRFLETGELQKVGADRVGRRIDVRVIAATNRALAEMVAQGLFREDLYYRLSTISVHLPALRQRTRDVALLARHFVDLFNARFGVRRHLGDDALAVLEAHAWPGNVRELLHVVEAAMVVCEGPVIRADHLPASVRTGRDATGAAPAAPRDSPAAARSERTLTLEEVERAHIEAVLRAHSGHRGLAAKALGISERNLYRKLREWGQD